MFAAQGLTILHRIKNRLPLLRESKILSTGILGPPTAYNGSPLPRTREQDTLTILPQISLNVER